MQKLSEYDIITALNEEKVFEATLLDGSLSIKVLEYVPYVCTAIHAGHRLNYTHASKCNLSPDQRLEEEDPYTDLMIESFPITIVANDSRYEYDLNRKTDCCIYHNAWGIDIWNEPLSDKQKQASVNKHACYYRILKALLTKLKERFGASLLVDVHSYNWQIREHQEAPIFNIGTAQTDSRRWRQVINTFKENLALIKLPNLETQVGLNTVFQGKGYQAQFIKQNFPETLTVPLEIKKIFMDEKSGELFPLVLEELQKGLYLAVLEGVSSFNKKLTRTKNKANALLPSQIEPEVYRIDKALFRLAKNIETLNYVIPINIQQEKRAFLSRKKYTPNFRYRQLRIDPYDFRQRLYKLPVSDISDPLIRDLYRAVVDSYATKVELLAHVGDSQFLYNSLRYYGEPSTDDIENAKFLLHACELPEEEIDETSMNAQEALHYFENAIDKLQLNCRVILSPRIVAKAMVDNSRKTLIINRDAKLTQFEVNALIHHELGVHMMTTENSLLQPINVFKLGLPGNTYTQEGLAIMSEYLSGNINLPRLKELSLRVLAVDMMVKGKSFSSVYHQLYDEYNLNTTAAFSLTTRVFRGGGFTKDYLYLRGFRDILKLNNERDISSLLIGKTGCQFIDILDSLTERGILHKPKYTTPAFKNPTKTSKPILDYLISALK